MPYFNPSKPRQPRISTPKAPAEPVEFVPPGMDVTPEQIPEEKETSEIQSSPINELQTPMGEADPSETNSENATDAENKQEPPAEDAPPKKRGVGRPPRSAKSAPKQEAPASKSETKKKNKEQSDVPDMKSRTSLYLPPKDHKRLKMLCVDIDVPLTEFAASACLDAMYRSYQCSEPSCNCEFIVRSSMSDGEPACPLCGGKKLSRPYLP